MSKQKVLYIVHGLPPESRGGTEVYTSHLFAEFKQSKNFSPIVLARAATTPYWTNAIWGDELDPQLFHIHTELSDIFSLINPATDDVFKEFLLNVRPDVIHFQHYFHLSLSWLKVAKELFPSVPLILTTHEFMALCPNSGQMVKTKWQQHALCSRSSVEDCARCFPHIFKRTLARRERVVRQMFDYLDLCIGPSAFIKSRYVDWGFPESQFLVSENGQQHFSPLPKKTSGGKLRLCYFGQINWHKGLHVLLDAMQQLRDNPAISLDVYGLMQDNQEYNQRVLAQMETLPNVTYHGTYSSEQIPTILSEADATVAPSVWWENSPLVIQESFVGGVPVICSNIGGMAEKVVDGQSGLHFAVGDSADLANKILLVLNDPTALKRLTSGIKPPKTIRANRLELEELYASLTKRSR